MSADEAFRFFGEGQGQHQYVRFLHRFFQLIHGVGFIKKRGLGQVAGNGGEAAVERGKHFCHGLSNAAEACNEHSLFGKKFLMVAQDMEFPLLQSWSCSRRQRFRAMIMPQADSAIPRAQPPELQ